MVGRYGKPRSERQKAQFHKQTEIKPGMQSENTIERKRLEFVRNSWQTPVFGFKISQVHI